MPGPNVSVLLQGLVAFGCALAAGLIFAGVVAVVRGRQSARRAGAAAGQGRSVDLTYEAADLVPAGRA